MRLPYIKLISPTGDTINLQTQNAGDSDYTLLRDGTTGLFAVDIKQIVHTFPIFNQVAAWRPDRRIVTLQIHIRGDDYVDLMDKYTALANLVIPPPHVNDPLVMRVFTERNPLGRDLLAFYRGGLQQPKSHNYTSGRSDAVVTASFVAHNPYWHDAQWTTQVFSQDTGKPFLPFTTPFYLSPTSVIGYALVTNPGDYETFPIWKINGPGDNLRIENITSGKVVDMPGVSLLKGETLTIDAREGKKLVYISYPDGSTANAWSYVTGDSRLFAFGLGTSEIRIALQNTTIDTSVSVTFRPRYNMP